MKKQKLKKATKKRPSPPMRHDEDFKKMVIADYLDSNLSKEAIHAKYNIKANSAVTRWMRKFSIADPFAKTSYLGFVKEHHLKKKQPSQLELENKALQKKIRELESKLSDEKLRAEMYARAIDIAEDELHIPILKKSNSR